MAPGPRKRAILLVSTEGRVWSWLNNRLLAARMNSKGTAQVYLRGKTYSVSHLVLRAFIDPRPAGTYARHANGDHADCRLENLEWRPRAELRRGRRSPRTRCSQGHVLTPETVLRRAGRMRCLVCRPLPEVIEAAVWEVQPWRPSSSSR
jgi:hypothetical protein